MKPVNIGKLISLGVHLVVVGISLQDKLSRIWLFYWYPGTKGGIMKYIWHPCWYETTSTAVALYIAIKLSPFILSLIAILFHHRKELIPGSVLFVELFEVVARSY